MRVPSPLPPAPSLPPPPGYKPEVNVCPSADASAGVTGIFNYNPLLHILPFIGGKEFIINLYCTTLCTYSLYEEF